MKNPIPWASFEHFGVYYAHHCQGRVRELSVPITYIQRWWRQRHKSRKKLYPILRSMTVRESAARLKGGDSLLSAQFQAVEKLDGTNFGIRCDGEKFGRRFRVEGENYQRVPLTGTIPGKAQVRAIKRAMLGEAADTTKLVVYGELMCNRGKFDYSERGMGHKFFVFGAMLEAGQSNEKLIILREKGFVAYLSKQRQIRVTMNKTFENCVQKHGVSPVPILDQGPLRELCFRMKDTLMNDGIEGVVMTSDTGGLFKWKTSVEDESKTHQTLCSLLGNNSPVVLGLAGIDIPLVRCLIDVAKKKDGMETGTVIGDKRKNKSKTSTKTIYAGAAMDQALISAESKYDTLEVYFERGDLDIILNLLKLEVAEDLGATTKEEVKCVDKHVAKAVGVSFGKWKRANPDA